MLFIRPVRQKRNLIYNKFYQNMPKIFFIFKINKMEHHNLWSEQQMEVFKFNGLFWNFYPNLPETSFVFTMSKNKAYTWNEHRLNTRDGNLKVKLIILQFYLNQPKTFFNFKMSKIKIRKMSKIKIHIWEKHPWNLVNGCFCFLNPVWSNRKF